MSRSVNSQPRRGPIFPSPSGLGRSVVGSSLAADLTRVILIGLSPPIASHLMGPVRAVAANADLQVTRLSDLGMPRSFPSGTLLILQDRRGEADGLKTLRQLRGEGVATPAILVVTESEFVCPGDIETLGDLDVLPLAEFSRFAFRRSLILLGSRAVREKLLAECAGRLRAYERVLAARDEERMRILDVAKSLEHRLSSAEAHSQVNESTWADRLTQADARIAQLEAQLAEKEGRVVTESEADAGSPPNCGGEPSFRQQRAMPVRDVRQVRGSRRAAQRAAANKERLLNLIARLQASEKVRIAQTQELLSTQRRNGELEQVLQTIAVLLESEEGTAGIDSNALLEELAARLMQIDDKRSDQRETLPVGGSKERNWVVGQAG